MPEQMLVLQRDLSWNAMVESFAACGETNANQRTGWVRAPRVTNFCVAAKGYLCRQLAYKCGELRDTNYLIFVNANYEVNGLVGTVAHVLNLCHARRFIPEIPMNGMHVVSALKARPVLEKVSQGFVVFFVLPLGC